MIHVTTETKFIGLLGYPLKQSHSSLMQNRAFAELGLNYIYVPIEVTKEDLAAVVKGMVKMNYAGFNITKPHKLNIMKYVDELDALAKIIGAVNTVTIQEGRLKGYNTDGTGFVRSLEKEKGFSVENKNVFILGGGGASQAIATACAYKGAGNIYLSNRTPEKALALARDINLHVRDCSVAFTMGSSEMKEALNKADLFINTTSVGMTPHTEETPLEAALLHKNMLVCDVIYNPLKTRLLREAEQAGCETLNGLGMLLYQGAEAFTLWTGRKAPVEIMSEVLHHAAKGLNK